MTTKKQKKEEQKKEIIWNLINSGLAGLISFFSAFIATGFKLNWASVLIAFIAALLVATIRFKSYWDGEQNEYCKMFGRFI